VSAARTLDSRLRSDVPSCAAARASGANKRMMPRFVFTETQRRVSRTALSTAFPTPASPAAPMAAPMASPLRRKSSNVVSVKS
jgi:hypothetical protein